MTGNIIKVRATNGGSLKSSIKKEAHEASLEAKQILMEARAEAERLLDDAERQKESVFAEASKRGYEAGLDKWNQMLTEAWKLREQFLVRNESELVKLAAAIAGKIIGHEVQSDPSVIVQVTREALRAVSREKKLVIQVNPSDESTLREQTASLRTLLDGSSDLRIVSNPSIARGGCIVESELGIVDAQLATQLASLERALLRRSNDDNR
jgi:type III secretion protein L